MFPSLIARETKDSKANLARDRKEMLLNYVKNFLASRTNFGSETYLSRFSYISRNNVSPTMFPS